MGGSHDMFLQLLAGVLFLMELLSVSFALPPCVCAKNMRPVCGSDGQTYSNECLLQCAQVSNPQLSLERSGRCDGSSLGPPKDVRQTQGDCTVCTLEYMPLCGTDGRTYPNRCTLDCAKRSSSIEIAYPGVCKNKRGTGEVLQLPTTCSCPRTVAPVCGSDGYTYDSACVLDCVSQNNPELRLQYAGSCRSEVRPCLSVNETNPVCGTDGNIYENPCSLKRAKQNNTNLEVLHLGECDRSVRIITEECIGCTLKVKPVCGTDGNIYRNPCMLNCAREQNENLHIDYEGPCDSRLKVIDSPACARCTRIRLPVCGTDGNTYRNPCMLNCARHSDGNLHVDYEGPCNNNNELKNLNHSTH